ncbi:MAG: hypothetical protein IT366_07065 [Candidatus Hydrogenedentes bacterium]|nr:hypothetical protein [Candidatus Hydrogenedentota bacterium]
MALVPGNIEVSELTAKSLESLRSQSVREEELQADGSLSLKGIEPGHYTLFVAAMPRAVETDAEALESMRVTSTQVEVVAEETNTITLTAP